MPGADPTGALIRAMLDLRTRRQSGVLTVRAQGISTSVVFVEGEPISAAEEGTPGEPLGRLLVRTHVISQEQHARIIDAMASSLGSEQEEKFGETAVRLGILKQAVLDYALSEQVRWRIVRALQRDGTESAFETKAPAAGEIAPKQALHLEAIVLDAARWFTPDKKKTLLAENETKYVGLREPGSQVAERFRMTREEEAALTAFDGSVTVGDLVALGDAEHDSDIGAVVLALTLTGVAELATMPKPTSLMFKPDLSVRPPAGLPQPPRENERRARAVLRLKKAQGALPEMSLTERRPTNEREARVLAEQAFQHGLAHLRANRMIQAVPLFRRSFGLMPKNLEYELYAMWVEVRVLRDKATDAQLGALRNIAVAAIRQNPNLAFAYYVLGQVTLAEGSPVMAKRHFSHALRLDPEAIDAERHIRILQHREAKASRVPQLRSLTPLPGAPGEARRVPRASMPGHAVARVALKKAPVDSDGKVAPPPLPAQAKTTKVETPAEPFVLYAKTQKTLELPPEIGTAAHEGAQAKTEAPAPAGPTTEATRGSPLPDGPSSLTAVARVTEGEAPTPPGPKPSPPAAAPKKNRTALYAGVVMTLGVLVAAFAMFGLRAGHVTKTQAAPLPAAPSSNVQREIKTDLPNPVPVPVPAPGPSAASVSPPPSNAPSVAADAGPPKEAALPPITGTNRGDGTLNLPKWAVQRRIFVDGKLVSQGTDKLTLSCGTHQVKIGSNGNERTIDVPCGSSVDW